VIGYVASIGATEAKTHPELSIAELRRITEASQFASADPDAGKSNHRRNRRVQKNRDTLGGIVEVVATGFAGRALVVTLQWDRKLDGRLAFALLTCRLPRASSSAWDSTLGGFADPNCTTKLATTAAGRRFTRHSNNSGGTEGGMSTGEPLRVRVAFKPLVHADASARSVDIKTKAEAVGAIERFRRMREFPQPQLLRKRWWRLSWRQLSWKNSAAIRWSRLRATSKAFIEQVRNY